MGRRLRPDVRAGFHSCSFVSIRGSAEGLFLRLLRFFTAKGFGALAARPAVGPYQGESA